MGGLSEYEWLIWLGILFCLSQSAMFSGLNLALLGISRLRLEIEGAADSSAAKRILNLRNDTNFLLTTILWGNVGINVLLTLLSNSVLAGISAFLFSTVFITFFGEIAPQAYFSRNALKMGSLFAPVLRFYQFVLYPVAKPSALVLAQGRHDPEGQPGVEDMLAHELVRLRDPGQVHPAIGPHDRLAQAFEELAVLSDVHVQ